MPSNYAIKIYSDGADIDAMRKMATNEYLSGFTTNPSLMKRAGVTNYLQFAKSVVKEFPRHSVSFEVFGTTPDTMKKEAEIISNLGDNVYVKIPIMNLAGNYNTDLIHELSADGIKVNVTAITTDLQVQAALAALCPTTPAYVSLFVGRVADTGADPIAFVKNSVEMVSDFDNVETLWASTREVYNIIQAQQLGIDIITVPPVILQKLNDRRKLTADDVALDTVHGFDQDIKTLGFSILDEAVLA